MTALQGTLRVHQGEQTVTFQAEGVLRMPHSQPLRRFAEKAVVDGASAVHVDLRRCTYMDSTFIGTLLCLHKELGKARREFAIVSPSVECRQLFRQMGLDGVLNIATREAPPGPWLDLASEIGEVDVCKRNVLQAHRSLADLEGPAAEQFRAVMRMLDRDVKAEAERAR